MNSSESGIKATGDGSAEPNQVIHNNRTRGREKTICFHQISTDAGWGGVVETANKGLPPLLQSVTTHAGPTWSGYPLKI